MIEYLMANQGVFLLAIMWTLFWKGLVLWKTAREEKKYWFIFFLLVNTFGILDIIYLYIWPLVHKKKEIPS